MTNLPQLPPALSPSDAKILNTVFDPESAPEAPRITVDATSLLPADPHITDTALLSSLREQELAAVRLVEQYRADNETDQDAGKHAVYLRALAVLDDIVARNPSYASAWNNRSQLRRWRYGDRGVLTTSSATATAAAAASVTSSDRKPLEARRAILAALRDLDMAIKLASPKARAQDTMVSPAQGKLLAQAWTQRAAIFWGAAKDLGTPGTALIPTPASGADAEDEDARSPEWAAWDKTRFEEEGSRCFFMAGLYGSEVGRAMAVLSNPTAKLCGGIVKEAMRRERCGV